MVDSITFLQVFLLVNVFLMGALVAVGLRHAYAHFRPEHHNAEKPTHQPERAQLPRATKERLLQEAEASFKKVLDRSAVELEQNQKAITAQLNKQFEKIGSQVVLHEMARYQSTLEELRKQAEKAIAGAQDEVSKHQAEINAKFAEQQAVLRTQLTDEMAAEKQHLIQQMDTKLADAVASFLVETLPHNVDLGAQSAYLTTMLEEHKADLIKGISNEA